ncbi:DUF397 domain-containing protein [Streptomyces sp. NBC_01288]|uniref:DUF397 domain-containing protein n=1 Tax=Streptomyces sp. NBC_01288 TaxID=2903814 RepID=UPI002E0E1412|nr:DUF397 domain-containing protein [Streptomyces sp. NBC_01288]
MSDQLTWFKSSYSDDEGADCVEVAFSGIIHIRDSKNLSGPELALPAPAWTAFLSGVSAVQPGA